MAGKPRNPDRKVRVDTGTKRGNYKTKHDPTGKTFKENHALKSFWSSYKMIDIIQLSSKDLDILIDKWLSEFEQIQLERNHFWNYPEAHYDPTPKKKGPKKVNTSFNSSFIRR